MMAAYDQINIIPLQCIKSICKAGNSSADRLGCGVGIIYRIVISHIHLIVYNKSIALNLFISLSLTF